MDVTLPVGESDPALARMYMLCCKRMTGASTKPCTKPIYEQGLWAKLIAPLSDAVVRYYYNRLKTAFHKFSILAIPPEYLAIPYSDQRQERLSKTLDSWGSCRLNRYRGELFRFSCWTRVIRRPKSLWTVR